MDERSRMIDAQTFLRSWRIATTIRWAFSKTVAPSHKAPHSPKLRDPPRRVSPRAFPKRFMNYVDRSWCGRSACKPAASTIIHRTFLHWQNAVCQRWVWWMNPCCRLYSERDDTLSRRPSHHAVSSFIRPFVLFAIIQHIDMRVSSEMLPSNLIMYMFQTIVCDIDLFNRTKVKILWHYVSKLPIYFHSPSMF